MKTVDDFLAEVAYQVGCHGRSRPYVRREFTQRAITDRPFLQLVLVREEAPC